MWRRRKVTNRPYPAPDQRGFAMPSVLTVLLLLFAVGSMSLLYGALELRSTSSYRNAAQALFAAESGILHALSTINKGGVGIVDFKTQVVDRWNSDSGLLGSGAFNVPGHSRVRYLVEVEADATDPRQRGVIRGIGVSGQEEARRVVEVRVRRGGSIAMIGAIYLASEDVDTTFRGNAFTVDGYDHDLNGELLPEAEPRPGIATQSDEVTEAVVSDLSGGREDNVVGFEYDPGPPISPSVKTTDGPSVEDLEEIVSWILSQPGVFTTNRGRFTGTDVFGTIERPQITHMTNRDVKLAGTATGAGILIVDGSLTITGTLDFVGWILVRGATIINAQVDDGTTVLGNAVIRGSLWTGDLEVTVGGSAVVEYCSECLNSVANGAGPDGAQLLPQAVQAVSWREVL